MSPIFLADIPTELIEEIISAIDHPRDLLSLALSNSSFEHIIIPYHIQFRHISCDSSREYLWQYLSDYPLLAARIRQIEIFPEGERARLGRSHTRKLVVPIIVSESPPRLLLGSSQVWDHPGALLPLAVAVRQMPNLRRFGIVKSFAYEAEYFATFLAVMSQHCPNLTELQATIRLFLPPHIPLHPDSNIKYIGRIGGLSKISLIVGSVNRPLVAAVMSILNNSPRLQDLSLSGSKPFHPLFTSLLDDCHWPLLKRLVLSNILLICTSADDEEQADPLIPFFARHDQLESLCIDQSNVVIPGSISPGALPKLYSLQFCQDSRPLSTIIPMDMHRRLSFLAVGIAQYDLDVIANMTNLRRLWITTTQTPSGIAMLVEAAPLLQRLRFIAPSGTTCIFYAEALSRLTELTHLYIHSFSHQDQLTPQIVVEKLAVVPKLKYISQVASSTIGIELVRDASGRYPSHKAYKLLAGDDARHSWGEIFTEVFDSPYYLSGI